MLKRQNSGCNRMGSPILGHAIESIAVQRWDDFRNGSFASFERRRHVGFTPDSGRMTATQRTDALGHKQTSHLSFDKERGNQLRYLKKKPQPGAGASNFGVEREMTLTLLATPIGFQGLSSLLRRSTSSRWSTRLDIDGLGSLNGLGGLLDGQMQYALVEVSIDGSVFWLEW